MSIQYYFFKYEDRDLVEFVKFFQKKFNIIVEKNSEYNCYDSSYKNIGISIEIADDEWKSMIRESVNIETNIYIGINPRINTDEERKMMKILKEIVGEDNLDFVFLFNGELPILLRKNGKTYLNKEFTDYIVHLNKWKIDYELTELSCI